MQNIPFWTHMVRGSLNLDLTLDSNHISGHRSTLVTFVCTVQSLELSETSYICIHDYIIYCVVSK